MRLETLPEGGRRIYLDAPILLHDEPRMAITLRAPTFIEVMTMGDPQTIVIDGKGGGVTVTDRALLRQWFRLLLADHVAEMVEAKGTPALALLVEEAILDFFTEARRLSKPPVGPASPGA